MSDELITLEKTDALAIFREPEKREMVISKFRKIAEEFAPNLETDKGRKEVASMAHKVRTSKTYVVAFGKDAITELKEQEKALVEKIQKERTDINDGVKLFIDAMDAVIEDIRRPLTEWETKKAEQVKRDAEYLKEIKDKAKAYDQNQVAFDSTVLNQHQDWLISQPVAEGEIGDALDAAISANELALKARIQYEKDQAELAKLKKEAEAREKAEYEEKIKRDAAEAARLEEVKRNERVQAEREREAATAAAAIKKAQDDAIAAKAAAEKQAADAAEAARLAKEESERRAENARLAAEQVAAENAKAVKLAAEQVEARHRAEEKRIADEKAQREADLEYGRKIKTEAKESLISIGISEKNAIEIVKAICAGSIKNVTINF